MVELRSVMFVPSFFFFFIFLLPTLRLCQFLLLSFHKIKIYQFFLLKKKKKQTNKQINKETFETPQT